jgi:hypothetical protein
MWCLADYHCLAIDYPIFDVIDIFMEMARHRPIDWPPGKLMPHPMFLHSKLKWRLFDDIWFSVALIGRNQLHLIVYRLTMDFPELKKNVLSNKTCKSVGIPHMEEAMVPWEYGMEVIM